MVGILRTKLADHTNNVIRPHFENLLSERSEKTTGPILNIGNLLSSVSPPSSLG